MKLRRKKITRSALLHGKLIDIAKSASIGKAIFYLKLLQWLLVVLFERDALLLHMKIIIVPLTKV